MNVLKSECNIPRRYGMPTTNKGESADFAHFDPKIGCYGKFLERSEKDEGMQG